MDDLGDTNARALAAWPHEPVRLEFCGAGRYRLAGNTSQRSNASFIFNNLLWDRGHQMNSENTNSGGWEESGMRQFISNRMMAAMPIAWESMIAKVKINATIGNQSSDIYTSEDYIYIPCKNELDGADAATYAEEGDHIEWFTSDAMRAKFKGIIIQEDATYYSGSVDPTTVPSNDVKHGDVWKSQICYVYVDEDYLAKYNIEFMPKIYKYAEVMLSNSNLKTTYQSFANNDFFKALFIYFDFLAEVGLWCCTQAFPRLWRVGAPLGKWLKGTSQAADRH